MLKRKEKHVLIVAGEASGDLHGSNLVKSMWRLDPGIVVQGIGGKKMKEAGVNILIPSSDMAVVGLTEVFARLNSIVSAYFRLKNLLKKSRPDLLILIDYPDFNINLARSAKRCGVPVLYYISPQVWAWRRGRIKKIARRVDRMAVILPFEKDVYNTTGLDVEYVGHPVLDSVPGDILENNGIRKKDLVKEAPIIGLLPGSRSEEIKNLLPIMLKAVELVSSRFPDLRCVLPVAPTVSDELILSIIGETTVNIRVVRDDFYGSLYGCDLAMVASGTATLETAIMGVPMIIAYRVSPLTFLIARVAVKVPFIGLVNLVAGEEIVPELIQNEVTPGRLAHETISILDDDNRRVQIMKKLKGIREMMGKGGASERTAWIAMEMMKGREGRRKDRLAKGRHDAKRG